MRGVLVGWWDLESGDVVVSGIDLVWLDSVGLDFGFL